MSEENKNGNSIEGFEGWDDASGVDLFNGLSGGTGEEDVMSTVLKDDIEVGEQPAAKEEEKEEGKEAQPAKKEDDLFSKLSEDAPSGGEDKEEEEGDKAGKQEPKKSDIASSSLLLTLKERGLVEYELEEGEELTDELADEILEDSLEQRFETMVEEKFSGLDPSVKEIVKYNLKGGNIRELLTKLVPQGGISVTEDMDLESEENQILLVTRDRMEKGESKEEINTYVEYLKDSGKLKSVSEKLHGTFVKADKEIAKKEADKRAQVVREQKEREREYRSELSTFIGKEKDFEGVKLTRQEQRELPAYIAETSVQLEDGRKISPLHRDIFLAMKDKKKVVLLAKLLKDDFKLDQFGRAEKTKKVGEIKDGLQGKATPQRTKKVEQKALADYF